MSDAAIDPRKHRRSIRLKAHDYSGGVFFITLCIEQRACVLGEVVDGQMMLSEVGQIAQECWDAIPDHFEHAICDAFVVMPNHVHAILALQRFNTDSTNNSTQPETRLKLIGATKGSLGSVVGSYKAAVSKRVNNLWVTPGAKFWQRNYHERIIRNDNELQSYRDYIAQNPARWHEDQENPRFYLTE